uniref:Btz domain-containing protein n=1 Tax=Steinernema glaseri TaxID=37863 RepID=A0A1I7XXX5_9BILA
MARDDRRADRNTNWRPRSRWDSDVNWRTDRGRNYDYNSRPVSTPDRSYRPYRDNYPPTHYYNGFRRETPREEASYSDADMEIPKKNWRTSDADMELPKKNWRTSSDPEMELPKKKPVKKLTLLEKLKLTRKDKVLNDAEKTKSTSDVSKEPDKSAKALADLKRTISMPLNREKVYQQPTAKELQEERYKAFRPVQPVDPPPVNRPGRPPAPPGLGKRNFSQSSPAVCRSTAPTQSQEDLQAYLRRALSPTGCASSSSSRIPRTETITLSEQPSCSLSANQYIKKIKMETVEVAPPITIKEEPVVLTEPVVLGEAGPSEPSEPNKVENKYLEQLWKISVDENDTITEIFDVKKQIAELMAKLNESEARLERIKMEKHALLSINGASKSPPSSSSTRR